MSELRPKKQKNKTDKQCFPIVDWNAGKKTLHCHTELQFRDNQMAPTATQRSGRSGGEMLTEPLLAVAELQPLYGSVDAVRAHDRPGNEQKTQQIQKHINILPHPKPLSLALPLSLLRVVLQKIIKS